MLFEYQSSNYIYVRWWQKKKKMKGLVFPAGFTVFKKFVFPL